MYKKFKYLGSCSVKTLPLNSPRGEGLLFMLDNGRGSKFCPGLKCPTFGRLANGANVRIWQRNHGLAIMEYS